ncbi:MAG: hypothetical protein ABSH22_06670 [Tepidisphaeraceae bacterium]|jgi:hypothetical protein
MSEPNPKNLGRPRKNLHDFARWIPPENWGRLVVWMSADERKALKRMALEADVSVAELIRSLASGLAKGAISAGELLHPVKKGLAVMEKIPTLFDRDGSFRVTDKVRAGCEWVIAGEGIPTEKLDGTNVRLTVRSGQLVRVEKRRNPSPKQKHQGIIDGWYVDADEFSPDDRWLYEAARNTAVSDWPDGEHPSEALGPNIQGNELGLEKHVCLPFNLRAPVYSNAPRTFAELRTWLERAESLFSPGHPAEGIVFHHPDGRRAKIKRRDFFRA